MTGADFGGVDIDLLADYIGGALTGTPEESVVAARIADDPAWLEAYESLGEGMLSVSAELARLAPEPMPADLADRLDTMLTGFVTLDAEITHASQTRAYNESGAVGEPGAVAGPEDGAPGLGGPPSPELTLVRGGLAVGDGAQGVRKKQAAPRRGRRLRWAAPIAVAAGLVAFVGFGLDYLAGTEKNSASTDSGSGVAAARGGMPKFAPSGGERTLASGTDYTRATLGLEAPQPLGAPAPSTDSPAHKTSPEMASGVESALQRLTAPSALAECLAAIEQANGGGALSAESVDYARFNGAPAVIVRFTAGNGRWAWASSAECGTPAGGAATLDKVPVG